MDERTKATEARMQKSIESLKSEYSLIRAGRANPALLDRIQVDYYGVPTPINQMAVIAVPEARVLQIQPWDASTIRAIEKAINMSDIGINPQNDGRVIRLIFPPLTEERRRDLTKDIAKLAEQGKVAVRNIRRDAMDKLKDAKKKSEITEDDQKLLEKELQDLTDKFCKQVDQIAADKEKEIMEV